MFISIVVPPWQIFAYSSTYPSNVTYGGLVFNIINHMANTLNFTYRVILPTYGNWGERQNDGTWDGMTGIVASGQVSNWTPVANGIIYIISVVHV